MLKRVLSCMLALCMLATCAVAEATYQPGTYEATEAGFGGDVTVTMTFDDSRITDVKIAGDAETDGVGSKAVEALPAAILKAQSADVDGVSGASFTSKAILLAAQDCIDQAKGVSEEAAIRMKPGEYVGKGIGFRISEPVTVTVTVSEDKIENIVVDQENISDTKAMVQTVVDTLVPRMLEYQSVSVDAVCGATATSNGVRQAAEAALVEAITAAGGDAKDVKAFYHSIPQVNKAEELSADVLVVGLGGSGMAAALSSAEHGLNVLAIDKAAKFGGNAVLTSGPMAINVPSQVAAEIPEWTDPTTKEVITKKAGDDLIDKEALYQAWLEYTTNDAGEQQAKPEMVRLFLDESGYTDDWLTRYGFQFDPASGFAGNTWAAYTPISGGKKLTEGFFAECMENFVKLGGAYMLETEAYDLIVEDGVVVGAKAHSMVDGRDYLIHAKAVVLATGGFAGSGEMEEKYLQNTYFPLKGEWRLFGMHQNDGRMIEAAIQNGAGTYNISVAPMVHVGGVDGFLPGFETVPVEGEIGYATGRPAVWSQGDLPLNMAISSDTLAVGKDAKRFTAETALSMFNPWIAGPHFYSIYGNDQVQKLKTEGFDEVPYGPSTSYLGYGTGIPAGVPMDQADTVLQAAIDAGYVLIRQGSEVSEADYGRALLWHRRFLLVLFHLRRPECQREVPGAALGGRTAHKGPVRRWHGQHGCAVLRDEGLRHLRRRCDGLRLHQWTPGRRGYRRSPGLMKWRTIRVRFQGQGDAISSGFDCVSVSLYPALGSAIRSCGVSMITAKSPLRRGFLRFITEFSALPGLFHYFLHIHALILPDLNADQGSCLLLG